MKKYCKKRKDLEVAVQDNNMSFGPLGNAQVLGKVIKK
jgi:hypothetical protein